MQKRESLGYHPNLFTPGGSNRGRRKVQNRLRAMLKHFDFRGTSVLDLGCNGGYFSFKIAQYARYVLGIDADRRCIQNNRYICENYCLSNIQFEVATITPSLIKRLPVFDVTLFLSVLHHIMASSGVYKWNSSNLSGIDYALEILKAISLRTKTLFFEMGQSNESSEWAGSLPRMDPRPDIWIVNELLKPAGFIDIHVIEPPDWQGISGSIRKFVHAHKTLEVFLVNRSLVSRAFSRIIQYDTRDCRYLFIAKSNHF